MSNLEKNKRHSTSVITDLRNFSKTFKDFQNNDSEKFLEFIEEYYSTLNYLAGVISEKVWIDSIGDGMLAIFLDKEDHHKKGYAYILAVNRALNKMCAKFIEENPSAHVSFGTGADSGNVWRVGKGYLNTYVGTVINRASRIEATTKLFGKSTTAIGNSLYKNLVRDFYPNIYASMEGYPDYDTLLNSKPETMLISKKLMLYYAHDMQLKGIQSNAPIFKMSESLVQDDELYWGVMNKLVGKEKVKRIKNIID